MNEYSTHQHGEEPNHHPTTSVPIDVWSPDSDDTLDKRLQEWKLFQVFGGDQRYDIQPDTWSYLSREGRALARDLGEAMATGPLGDEGLMGELVVTKDRIRLIRSDVYYRTRKNKMLNLDFRRPLGIYDSPDQTIAHTIRGDDKVDIGEPHIGKTPEFYLVYTGPGLYCNGENASAQGLNPSWKSIKSTEQNSTFQLKAGGEIYDTRDGMNQHVYATLIYNYFYRGEKPWESGKDSHGQPITRVWLTGAPRIGINTAWRAWVDRGEPMFFGENINYASLDTRFRPAVKIPTIPTGR